MTFEDFILPFLNQLSGFSAIMIGFLFLTVKSKNRTANTFLVIFLWCLAWLILSDKYIDHDEIELLENSEVFHFDTALFLIPSLFLYILKTVNKSFSIWYLLLFIPGVVANIFSNEENMVFEILTIISFLVLNLTLMIIAFRILIKHQKRVVNFYSALEHKTLSWIKSIIITVFVLHFILISEELAELFNLTLISLFEYAESLTISFMVYWIGYNGFFQAQSFEGKNDEELQEVTETQNTHIVNDNAIEKFKRIEDQIKLQELFKNPNLNLRLLATELDIKERELSKLINQCSQTNFYNFINRFRVEEYKNLLESPKSEQFTILGLAEDVGFSSKSTFYTAFKSIEGMTPKQYKSTLNRFE